MGLLGAWNGRPRVLRALYIEENSQTDLPGSPDFVLSVQHREELQQFDSNASYCCFQRLSHHVQVQEQQQRDLKRSNVSSRNEQIQCDHHRYALSHDHTYTSQGEEELRDTNVYAQDGLEIATMDIDCEEPHNVYTQDGLELATMDVDCEEPHNVYTQDGLELATMNADFKEPH